MTTYQGVRQYAGICIGGPCDGMMRASSMPTFRVSENPAILLSVEHKRIPTSLVTREGTYEFDVGKDGRQSEWRWKGWR